MGKPNDKTTARGRREGGERGAEMSVVLAVTFFLQVLQITPNSIILKSLWNGIFVKNKIEFNF